MADEPNKNTNSTNTDMFSLNDGMRAALWNNAMQNPLGMLMYALMYNQGNNKRNKMLAQTTGMSPTNTETTGMSPTDIASTVNQGGGQQNGQMGTQEREPIDVRTQRIMDEFDPYGSGVGVDSSIDMGNKYHMGLMSDKLHWEMAKRNGNVEEMMRRQSHARQLRDEAEANNVPLIPPLQSDTAGSYSDCLSYVRASHKKQAAERENNYYTQHPEVAPYPWRVANSQYYDSNGNPLANNASAPVVNGTTVTPQATQNLNFSQGLANAANGTLTPQTPQQPATPQAVNPQGNATAAMPTAQAAGTDVNEALKKNNLFSQVLANRNPYSSSLFSNPYSQMFPISG